ncbi:Uncharacterised protein [uncultured archaeon]|nr:Uncharacterised protein [uncultured archaeon]
MNPVLAPYVPPSARELAFLQYVDRHAGILYSKEKGKTYVCSTLTKEAYDVLGFSRPYGPLPLNVAQEQYVRLAAKLPNIDESRGLVHYGQNSPSFIGEGGWLQLPMPDGGLQAGRAGAVRQEGLRAYFEAGANRYVAEVRMVEGRAQTVIGLADGGMASYPTLKEYGREELEKPQMAQTLQAYYEAKSADPNQADRVLKPVYPLLIASHGGIEFTAFGYDARIAQGQRHSVLFKYLCLRSEPMSLEGGELAVPGSDLRGQLNRFLANIPPDAAFGAPKADKQGRLVIPIRWTGSTRLPGVREKMEPTPFEARLVLDFKAGQAYYVEQASGPQGNRLADYVMLQAPQIQLIPLSIVPDGGRFRLEFNHLVMFESIPSNDPTGRLGAGDLYAHVILPEQMEADFVATQAVARYAFLFPQLEAPAPKPLRFGQPAEYDSGLFAAQEHRRLFADRIYGLSRMSAGYGMQGGKDGILVRVLEYGKKE